MKPSLVFVVLCYCISLYVMSYVRVNKKAQHKSLLWPNLSSTFCPSRQSLLRRIFPRGLFLVRCPDQISFGWSTYCRAPSSTKHCWMSFFGIQAIAFGRQVCTYEVRRKEYDDDGFWGTVVRGLCTQEPPRTRFVVRYLCLHHHFFHVMIVKKCDTKPLRFEL